MLWRSIAILRQSVVKYSQVLAGNQVTSRFVGEPQIDTGLGGRFPEDVYRG
jgi:hypothetical protein